MIFFCTVRHDTNAGNTVKSAAIGNLVRTAELTTTVIEIVTQTCRIGIIIMVPWIAFERATTCFTAVSSILDVTRIAMRSAIHQIIRLTSIFVFMLSICAGIIANACDTGHGIIICIDFLTIVALRATIVRRIQLATFQTFFINNLMVIWQALRKQANAGFAYAIRPSGNIVAIVLASAAGRQIRRIQTRFTAFNLSIRTRTFGIQTALVHPTYVRHTIDS
jgi:hypothetical protein